MRQFARYLGHYTVLFGVLLASFAGLILFSYSKIFQTAIAVALVLAYISWGIVHHYLDRNLRIETVVEYFMVAILGFVIILSLIIRT